MTAAVPPPTAAEMRAYDRDWHGIPHRNLCVRMVRGQATIRVGHIAQYIVYASERADTLAANDERDGVLRIISPSEPHYTGRICLGISTEGK